MGDGTDAKDARGYMSERVCACAIVCGLCGLCMGLPQEDAPFG